MTAPSEPIANESSLSDTEDARSNVQLPYLEELVIENVSIAGDVVQIAEHSWAIHGSIAVDGDVLLAEFDSLDDATSVLAELSSFEHQNGSR